MSLESKFDAPTRWVVGIALLGGLVHAMCIQRFGWFRDELYYLACGRHPAWGYVDHPPLVGWLAALVGRTRGGSIVAARALPIVMGMAVTALTALMARRLGARSFGPVLAALAVTLTPTYLFMFHTLSMNCVEVLVATLAALWALSFDDSTSPRRWLVWGALMGLGLLNKHSLGFWWAALSLSWLACGGARWFTTARPWLAMLAALVIVTPHLFWQFEHGFATLEFYRNAQAHKIQPMTPLGFVTAQLTLVGPGNAPLWLVGLFGLLRRGSRSGKALGLAYVLLLVWFILARGKAYYLVPFYPVLYAAGGAHLERSLNRLATNTRKLAIAGVGVVQVGLGLAAAPVAFPVASLPMTLAWSRALGGTVPKAERNEVAELPQHLADMFGWDTLVHELARIRASLSEVDRARVQILASNYGQAAAVDWLGEGLGLPKAHSPHNAYYTWGAPTDNDGPVIVIGMTAPTSFDLTRSFLDVRQVGRNPCRYCMPGERDAPIYLCRHWRRPPSSLWAELKRYF